MGSKIKGRDVVFVSIQFGLFGLYVMDLTESMYLPDVIQKGGSILAILGVMIIAIAMLQLNKNLSPFPTPKSGGLLLMNGVYAIVRHPIYTGIILVTSGYGLWQESTWKLIVAGLLMILFHFKSKYEEKLLCQQFDEYSKYKTRVGRLVPKVMG